jgi:hypothetical protein
MIPAATATATNDISTLIASDPVSRFGKRLASVGLLRSTLSPMVPDVALFSPLRGHSDLTAHAFDLPRGRSVFGLIRCDRSYNMVNRCLGHRGFRHSGAEIERAGARNGNRGRARNAIDFERSLGVARTCGTSA